MTRYTTRLSTTMRDAASTSPRAADGAVARSTNDTKRVRMDEAPFAGSEVRRGAHHSGMSCPYWDFGRGPK